MAFIVRLDKEKKGKTHGWQVRGRGKRKYFSKLFSDGVYGSKGKALMAAEEFLETYLQAHPELTTPKKPEMPPYHYNLNRNNKTGINGVHRTMSMKPYKGGVRRYPSWCATYTGLNGTQQKKQFSVNVYGEEEAKRLAVEFRQMWEEAVDKGEKAVADFLDAYDEGWL